MKLLSLLAPFALLASCAHNPAPASLSSETASSTTNHRKQEQIIHRAINKYRTTHGKSALSYDHRLSAIARKHSVAMASQHRPGNYKLSHNGFSNRGKEAIALGMTGFGENVAVSHHRAKPNLPVIISGWIKSKDHYEVLMGDFNLSGVSTVTTPDGAIYATHLFGQQYAKGKQPSGSSAIRLKKMSNHLW